MNDLLRMSLLGPVVITQSQQEVTGFRSRKALALLIYLACTNGSQRREALADLLWGDCSQQQALSNLRTALVHLRDRVGDCLHSSHGYLSLNPQLPCWVDAVELQRQLAALLAQSAPLSDSAAQQLEQTLHLYQGDFLAGFHVQNAPYFEEWMLIEEERLRRMVIEGYQRLVAWYLAQGQYKAGLRSVDRWLALDRLDEIGHSQRICLLAADGQRAAALAQYETCRRILKDELGVEPAEQTVLLQKQIRAGQWTHQQRGASRSTTFPQGESQPFNNLPIALTLFIGRQGELANIADCLASPGCRLLTITGLRGMGKTALALQAAATGAAQFADGVCYVPIPDALERGHIAQVIAEALKLPVSGDGDLQARLFEYVRHKQLLLLLDNMEHLAADVGFVTALLQHAPAMKVLGTSLEPLNQRAEWLVSLHGLPVPDPPTVAQLNLPALVELLGGEQVIAGGMLEPSSNVTDALRLFIIRARQVQPRFQAAITDIPAIFQICRLVDGMPLAIEMAAEWVGSLSCSEIAEELEHNPIILVSSRHDVPVRQQSLETICAQAWRLLSPNEIEVLQHFESFNNRTAREILQQVTGATLPVLAALVQKSFLWRTSSGCYQMSELLRRYVARCAPEICV